MRWPPPPSFRAGTALGRRPRSARGRPLAAALVPRGDGPWPPPHAHTRAGRDRARRTRARARGPQVPKTPREGIRGKRGRATRRLAGRAAGCASWPATASACRIRRRGNGTARREIPPCPAPEASAARRPAVPGKGGMDAETRGGALGEEAECRARASGHGAGRSCGGGMPCPVGRPKAPRCVPDAGGHLGGQNHAAIPVPEVARRLFVHLHPAPVAAARRIHYRGALYCCDVKFIKPKITS